VPVDETDVLVDVLEVDVLVEDVELVVLEEDPLSEVASFVSVVDVLLSKEALEQANELEITQTQSAVRKFFIYLSLIY
jgi:hypothetical protein